jgi:hypothetical protein
MSKWGDLTDANAMEGGANSASKSGRVEAFGFGMSIWVVAAILVIAIVAFTQTSSSPSMPRQDMPEPELNVIQVNAAPDVAADGSAADGSAPASGSADGSADAPVEPKFMSKLWSTTEDLHKPFLESEGLGFSDYQKAFQQGRAPVIQERHYRNASRDILEPMREGLKSSGQTLESFMQTSEVALPDAFLDSWYEGPSKSSILARPESMDEETMMLAREALQSVHGSEETVTSTLREILAARTEAARLNFKLPQVPEEQMLALKHWSVKGGTAGSLAVSILSRI